jgi:uncharacterized membrane protein
MRRHQGQSRFWVMAVILTLCMVPLLNLSLSHSANARIEKDYSEYEKFKGIEIKRSIKINRPVAVVYRFWRNPENLPKIMCDVKKVTILDNKRSHWVIKGPLGMQIEWDSELTEDVPEKLLRWKSVEKSDVRSMGSVEFALAGSEQASSPEGEGTEVKVSLKFAPPWGRLGLAIARVFADDSSREVAGCLLELKHLMETGQNDISALNILTPHKSRWIDLAGCGIGESFLCHHVFIEKTNEFVDNRKRNSPIMRS